MRITEVRIKLMDDPTERLKAFCSITFDGSFVVRDLKIIEGTNGAFVAMPSRKLTIHCPKCRVKNHAKANYCNQCGCRLEHSHRMYNSDRIKLYADIAHPINAFCREMIQSAVLDAYENEKVQATQPGYICSYDDFDYVYDDVDGRETYFGNAHSTTGGPHHRVMPPQSEPQRQTHCRPY